MNKNIIMLFVIAISYSQQNLAVETISIVSDDQKTVSLLELYTSEGCSSCPPAEQYLKDIFKNKLGSNQVIPLAFHVDYWNYIGWEDPFSKPEYTKRQRKIASANKSRTIYTPQFVLHGGDFRRSRNLVRTVDLINKISPRATISLNASKVSNRRLKLTVDSKILSSINNNELFMQIALYENNLSSEINAGENSGRKLEHDYVVRNMSMPYPVGMKDSRIESIVDLDKKWNPENMGVVVFIQSKSTFETLQAVDLRLDQLF